MSSLRTVFEDDRGQLSSTRVFPAYLIVAALACWLAGVWIPSQAAHAQAGMSAFLTAAVTLFGAGKASERFGKQANGDQP